MNAELWNEKHQPGDAVIVTEDDGRKLYTKTRSVAWDLGDGTTVVKVRGKTGGYLLDRVQPVFERGTK